MSEDMKSCNLSKEKERTGKMTASNDKQESCI